MKRTHLLPALLVCLLARSAGAAEAMPSITEGLLQMLIGLAVVVGLLLGSLWLIKRISAPGGAARGMKIVGGLALGPRERVVLIEVADKVLVLGITAAGINTLHTLERAELPEEPLDAKGHAQTDFGQWLKKSLERRQNVQ